MQQERFQIPNISCGHCTAAVERELKELPGIVSVSADVDTKSAEVKWDSPATREQIIATLKEINYPASE
jgi:copper chaperone CopZ